MATQTELRLAGFHRPTFRPRSGQIYVCVRSVQLASKDIRPAGTEFKLGDLAAHHLRSLYQRRMIGIKDTPWTDMMLERWEDRGGDVIVADPPAKGEDATLEPFSSRVLETFGMTTSAVAEEQDSEE